MWSINRYKKNPENFLNFITLSKYKKPFPSIHEFIAVYVKRQNSYSINQANYHIIHNTTEPIINKSFIFYQIDVEELIFDTSNTDDFLVIRKLGDMNNIISKVDRTFYGTTRYIKDTNYVLVDYTSDFPYEQGYNLKVVKMKHIKPFLNTCNILEFFLIARVYSMSDSYTVDNFDISAYKNIILYHTKNADMAQHIYASNSFYFNFIFPFRLEISEFIPDKSL